MDRLGQLSGSGHLDQLHHVRFSGLDGHLDQLSGFDQVGQLSVFFSLEQLQHQVQLSGLDLLRHLNVLERQSRTVEWDTPSKISCVGLTI